MVLLVGGKSGMYPFVVETKLNWQHISEQIPGLGVGACFVLFETYFYFVALAVLELTL